MTKEEAKLVLDNARPQTKEIDRQFYDDEDLNNAIDMAIKALEQPTSDDCVSRKAVAEIINKQRFGIHQISMGIIKEKIESLPPVTPMQRWIPIITREPTEEEKEDYFEQNGEELCYMIDSPMPDNGQEVLVSVGDTVGEDIFDEDFWNFEGWDIENVDAWMPMPLSYQGKECNENGK